MMKAYMDKIHNYKLEQEEEYKKFIDANQSQFNYKHTSKGKVDRDVSLLSTIYEKENKNTEDNRLQFIQVSSEVEKRKIIGK